MHNNVIHIGHLIQEALKEQGRSATWLARQIHCSRTNIYKIFAKDNIDIKLLKTISLSLNINFFKILSENFIDE